MLMHNIKRSIFHYFNAVVAVTVLASCSSFVSIHTPNQNDRVRTIVLHYTAVDEATTLELFMNPKKEVSAHFVITEDKIYQLADLNRRTYHAGISSWKNRHSLNDTSIGIELVQVVPCSQSHEMQSSKPVCAFPDFTPKLINNLTIVLDYIHQQYPNIQPQHIIGHQDISPNRKIDPGPRFPWQYLNSMGYGAWYNDQEYFDEYLQLQNKPINNEVFYQALILYGYDKTQPKTDVINAFQAHFTPTLITGDVTQENMATILALLKKYQPNDYKKIIDLLKLNNKPND